MILHVQMTFAWNQKKRQVFSTERVNLVTLQYTFKDVSMIFYLFYEELKKHINHISIIQAWKIKF